MPDDIITNVAAIRIIELNARYLNPGKSADPFQGASEGTHKLSTCGNDENNQRLKYIIKNYLSQSTLTDSEKSYLFSLLFSTSKSRSPHTDIVLTSVENGIVQTRTWSFLLAEIFALVYLTLQDMTPSVWQLSEGLYPDAEQRLRLRELDILTRTMENASTLPCNTSLFNTWVQLLNEAEGKMLPLSLGDLIGKTINSYLVQLLQNELNIPFNDDSDPKGPERKALHSAFKTIFLPWLLEGKMPAGILNLFLAQNGSDSLKLLILSELARYGIDCTEAIQQTIDAYCKAESVAQWPCTFMPCLSTLHYWLKTYASFYLLNPGARGSTLLGREALSIIHWLKQNTEESLDWVEDIYFITRLFDGIVQYKKLNSYDGFTILPEDADKYTLIPAMEKILSAPQGLAKFIIKDSSRSESNAILTHLSRIYHQWRSLSHYDFILDFFNSWHLTEPQNLCKVRSALFIKMARLYFAEISSNPLTNHLVIYTPDSLLGRWPLPQKMSMYQINRILLHAINYPPAFWSLLFSINFIGVVNHVVNTNHPAKNYLQQFQHLIQGYYRLQYSLYLPLLELNADLIISANFIYPSKSFELIEFLCEQPNQNEELIIQIFANLEHFDFNARNDLGNTPLIEAAESGHFVLCKVILANQPVLEDVNQNDATALQVAADFGHFDICKLLIESGANINAASENTPSALCIAARNGNWELVRLLLKANADQRKCNQKMLRALDIAIINGETAVVNEFINAGADLNQPNYYGQPPLHLAISQNNLPLVDSLLASDRVNLEQQNKKRHSPLWHAVKKARQPIVEKLIAAGASLEGEDESLCDFAQRLGCSRICRFLRERFPVSRQNKRERSEQSGQGTPRAPRFFGSSPCSSPTKEPIKHPRLN